MEAPEPLTLLAAWLGESGERRVFFKTAFVFELSQTDPLPGVAPVWARQCVSRTRSMRPYSTASSGLKKRSRSMSRCTSSSGRPVCLA